MKGFIIFHCYYIHFEGSLTLSRDALFQDSSSGEGQNSSQMDPSKIIQYTLIIY